MKIAKNRIRLVLMGIAMMVPLSTYAEEGGGGHYMPGGAASFMDALPGRPGLAIANFFAYYDGSASIERFPYGGLITAGLDVTAYVDTVVVLYMTPLKILGGNYAFGGAIPYVWVDAKGHVEATGPGGITITRSKTDSADGLGDILLYPFMLGWTALQGDLKYDIRMGVYAPTGDYDKGQLANVGKNYWTFEPVISTSYISSKIGLELSAFAGVDFNTENEDTDYRSGTQFHLDVTAAQHLPLLGGVIGLGANAFYYEQISGDSGSGAALGEFKGRTLGIGPVLSYSVKAWGRDLAAELKWLPEIDVDNRLEGDYIWFKLGLVF